MYHIRKDTLAYFKSRMFLSNTDVSQISTQDVVIQMNQYFETSPGTELPDSEALTFYLLNHAFAELSKKFELHEPMGAATEVAEMYVNLSSKMAKRLVYYMLLIVTRESRHLNNTMTLDKLLTKNLGLEYAQTFIKFRNALPSGSDAAANYLRKHPPVLPLGVYLQGIQDVFNYGSFSGGYGGKPWGKITETLRKAVVGEISLEIMMDTAWTLAHNNGPMFNKGMLYLNYTHDLLKILDVQRSGQIPQLFAQGYKISGSSSYNKSLWEVCHKHFPEQMGGYVDWFKVEALGALKKYPTEKKIQEQTFGPSKKTVHAGELFHIAPNEYATIKIRKAA